MPAKTETPTTAQIQQLRALFLNKLQNDPPAEPFHPIDINRITNDDLWCIRFLEMYDLDMKVAFDKLIETCIWRRKTSAYDLNETNLRLDYLNDGVIFSRNKDIDGCPLLIFKTKLHAKGTKDMNEVMRVVVYWIERIHRETHMSKITLFFDMAGTSISGMDLDFVKRIIETIKSYYPNSLNYILIFEMAWVLNAAFRIIKGLLPAKALEILKTITKKDINTYVDKDNCFTSWGGNDNYEFSFIAEKLQPQPQTATAKTNGHAISANADDEDHNNNISNQDKKVHFANGSPHREPQMAESQYNVTQRNHIINMLRLNPNEYITFERGGNNESILELTCTSKYPVTYKIQTTSPEKFRVRPRYGFLIPNETVAISIILKPEHTLADGSKDKFLIMSMPTPDGMELTSNQMSDLWKQKVSSNAETEQHRLCCIYKNAIEPRSGPSDVGTDEMRDARMLDISPQTKKLERQLRFMQIMQGFSILVLLALAGVVVYLLKIQTIDRGAVENGLESGMSETCPKGQQL